MMKSMASQFSPLFLRRINFSEVERNSRLDYIRMEINVQFETVIDGRYFCSLLYLFRFKGIEVALQYGFVNRIIFIEDLLHFCNLAPFNFEVALHGIDKYIQSIWIQSALTFL